MKKNLFDNSVVLIDKPVGITSFDVVSRFRRFTGLKKVGHSGTLDKFASGLLIFGTGFATKVTRYFLESDKSYEAVVLLGRETDSCDITGEILSQGDFKGLGSEEIRQSLEEFRGEISQTPPRFSALKIGGRRASDLARRGEEVSLKPRSVRVDELELLSLDLEEGTLRFSIRCSKGTYIRSIARDLGEKLGCGACLKELRRTASGRFSVNMAGTLEDVRTLMEEEKAGISGNFILSPREALSHFGRVFLNEEASKRVLNGAYFTKEQVDQIEGRSGDPFLLFDNRHNLIAIVEIELERWKINFHSVFNNL